MPRNRHPSEATERTAQRIVERVQASGNQVGFDPASLMLILTSIVPMIVSCFNKPPKDTAAYVASKYDANTGEYDPALVRQLSMRIRKKARKDRVKMTADEIEATAIATLDEARESEGTTEEVQGVWNEAPALATFAGE